MQLTKTGSISAALAAATCTLLSANAIAADSSTVNSTDSLIEGWQFNSALLYYGETDRVKAAEAILSARGDFGDDKFLNLNLVLDSLTGASATGAVAQPDAQTFTRPSGAGSYTTAAGATPLDDTFRDTRVQLDASWEQPLTTNYRGTVGGHFSKEYDYLSLGINGNISRDFNHKNTTVSVGTSFSHDSINPEGGIPSAFTPMLFRSNFASEAAYQQAFDGSRRTDSDTKTTAELLFGVTQVINPNWLMQLNYSIAKADGYLSDPFKVLSVVNSNGITQQNLYEQRPDSRTKQSLYWQNKWHLSGSYLDLSYRYMWDDWSLNSHTADARWRFPVAGNWYIEPHARYYTQDEAEFYQPFLSEGMPLPAFASTDYRIGQMDAYTVGAKVGTVLEGGHDFAVRLEYYQQNPNNPGVELPGVLQDLELFGDVKAVMLQVSYSF
ncbi:MAG TPA: hypothetical protein DF774_00125 [Rheinheimera sp.]|uniref:DUF3570 domain-containing protein n=1 Tax=Rheinheimera sp. TaxID=1869214 RepID=UPI000EEA1B12|nr:DUF3570 domain-containing protein [Rheinheimera sp.]HCU64143.1 hypothetical protein [Rheinheimera sp.]